MDSGLMKKAKRRTVFWRCRFRSRLYFERTELRWKDKFASPRCERSPSWRFEWLWLGVYIEWGDDDYWEQWLWLNEYCDGDYAKAKETWGWVDYKTKESTWKDY